MGGQLPPFILKMLPELKAILACPVNGTHLVLESEEGGAGHRYQTIQGVHVLFRPDATDTLSAMAQSRALASKAGGQADDPWCVDTLGLTEYRKTVLLEASLSAVPVIANRNAGAPLQQVSWWEGSIRCRGYFTNLLDDLVCQVPLKHQRAFVCGQQFK
jgi:hypothetical protein